MSERTRSWAWRLWEVMLPGLISLYPMADPMANHLDARGAGTFGTTFEPTLQRVPTRLEAALVE